MALLEELQRKIHKYGLVPKLIAALPIVSFVCALVGAGWIFYLPADGQFRNTYISENALMPSQAYSYYRESEWNFLRGYRNEVHRVANESIAVKNAMVKSSLIDIGYSASDHHFQRLSPETSSIVMGANSSTTDGGVTGHNVYGILNAPRGDGTEAMVLAASWQTTDGKFNENGVSLVIALAKYFQRWTVWSKNIIVVITEDNQHALRSWVKAYHSTLDLTAGLIESALVVEYPGGGEYFDYLEISYEGVNGQLPNLDLLNSAVSISEHEGMQVSLQHVPKDKINENTYWARFLVLLSGIKELALAGLKPSKGSEVFSGYRIQAITLRAIGDDGNIDITTLGRVVEAVFRSVNNLLEKFHQSFFFYLMLAPRKFISIGTYLPSAVFLSISFALAALSQVLNSGLKPLQTILVKSVAKVVLIFLTIFTATAVFGSLLLYAPIGAAPIYYSCLISGLLLSTLPTRQIILANAAGFIGRANSYNPFILYASTAFLLHALCLLFTSLIITSILVVHFSLAYTVGICMLPLTFVRPITLRSHRYQEHINSLSLLASCPWFTVLVLGLLDSDFTTGPIDVMKGLLQAWNVFDCWTWFIIVVGWLPCWLSTSYIGSMIIDESEYGVVDLKKDL